MIANVDHRHNSFIQLLENLFDSTLWSIILNYINNASETCITCILIEKITCHLKNENITILKKVRGFCKTNLCGGGCCVPQIRKWKALIIL